MNWLSVSLTNCRMSESVLKHPYENYDLFKNIKCYHNSAPENRGNLKINTSTILLLKTIVD